MSMRWQLWGCLRVGQMICPKYNYKMQAYHSHICCFLDAKIILVGPLELLVVFCTMYHSHGGQLTSSVLAVRSRNYKYKLPSFALQSQSVDDTWKHRMLLLLSIYLISLDHIDKSTKFSRILKAFLAVVVNLGIFFWMVEIPTPMLWPPWLRNWMAVPSSGSFTSTGRWSLREARMTRRKTMTSDRNTLVPRKTSTLGGICSLNFLVSQEWSYSSLDHW